MLGHVCMLQMRIMEFFGFECGISPTGPNFPFLPQSVLKDYPVELTGHPALPSIPFFPYDLMPVDLSYFYQECIDYYLAVIQNPVARNIGVGIVAAAFIYCSWKINVAWNSDIILPTSCVDAAALEVGKVKSVESDGSKPKDNTETTSKGLPLDDSAGLLCASQTNIVGTEQFVNISEKFQRQLIDALCKLDDVRLRFRELESQKELLTAEIELRKKIAQKLQAENSSEREKRQHAELQMEMMEIENCQLRHLRKELTMTASQVEKLEKLIKEKDSIQTKLFEDNVVLPRAVAETRVKEFRTLQTRIRQLQAEVDATNGLMDSGTGCQQIRSSSSLWSNESSVTSSSPILGDISAQRKHIIAETSIILPDPTNTGQIPNSRRKLAVRLPNISRTQTKSPVPKISRSRTCPAFTSPIIKPSGKTPGNKDARCSNNKKPVTQLDAPWITGMPKSENLANTSDASSNKSYGVFAQIRAMISGFRDSGTDSECLTQFETPTVQNQATPTQTSDTINSTERSQDYPVSDEQSSVFMSASGGSDASDTDHRRDPVNSNSKALNNTAMHGKRLSKYKRDRRRNKEKVSMRRCPIKAPSGHEFLFSDGNIQEPPSDSSDWSHKGTLRNSPISTARESDSQICDKYFRDNPELPGTTMKNSDENAEDSGDSWIVIIPAAS